MQIESLAYIFSIICYCFFALLPLWFFLFFLGIFFLSKQKTKYFFFMPLSIVAIWIALLFFYIQTHLYRYNFLHTWESEFSKSITNPFFFIPMISLILIIILANHKLRTNYKLFFLPFSLILLWIFLFLYL